MFVRRKGPSSQVPLGCLFNPFEVQDQDGYRSVLHPYYLSSNEPFGTTDGVLYHLSLTHRFSHPKNGSPPLDRYGFYDSMTGRWNSVSRRIRVDTGGIFLNIFFFF